MSRQRSGNVLSWIHANHDPETFPTGRAIDALVWLRGVTKAIGPGFHPDTPADDYVYVDSDDRLFTDDEAAQIDADMDRAFTLLKAAGRDPYGVAIRVQRRLLGFPFPSY